MRTLQGRCAKMTLFWTSTVAQTAKVTWHCCRTCIIRSTV